MHPLYLYSDISGHIQGWFYMGSVSRLDPLPEYAIDASHESAGWFGGYACIRIMAYTSCISTHIYDYSRNDISLVFLKLILRANWIPTYFSLLSAVVRAGGWFCT